MEDRDVYGWKEGEGRMEGGRGKGGIGRYREVGYRGEG